MDNKLHKDVILKDLLGEKVELVTVQSLSPYIGPRILKSVK